jgi:hypothetical protein
MGQLKTKDPYKPVLNCCCCLAQPGSEVSSGSSSMKVEMIGSLLENGGWLCFED